MHCFKPQPDRPALDLHTLEGWKAELALVLVIYRDGLSVIDSHLSKYQPFDSDPTSSRADDLAVASLTC